MKATVKQKGVCITVILLFILATICGICLIPNVANANQSADLEIVDKSTDEMYVMQYSNVQEYIHSPQTRSSRDLATIIGLTDEERASLGSSLERAVSITVQETLLEVKVDDNGNTISSRAINPMTTTGEWGDIPNDKGKTGYMSAKVTIVQDPELYKMTRNKDGEPASFTSYGFLATCTMKWKKVPVYRMTDVFALYARDGGVYTEEAGECTFKYTQLFTGSTGSSSSSGQSTVSTYYTAGGWPAYKFNLPNNAYGLYSSTTFRNMELNATQKFYALDDFNFNMGYSHKELVSGDISVSFDGGISFSSKTVHRDYMTPNVHVDVILDPELEALKQ